MKTFENGMAVGAVICAVGAVTGYVTDNVFIGMFFSFLVYLTAICSEEDKQ